LNLPRSGKVTTTVTGFPADCKMQVTSLKGSTGLGTGIGTVTFDAPAGEIYLKVFLNPYAAACHESDWCAVQCRKTVHGILRRIRTVKRAVVKFYLCSSF